MREPNLGAVYNTIAHALDDTKVVVQARVPHKRFGHERVQVLQRDLGCARTVRNRHIDFIWCYITMRDGSPAHGKGKAEMNGVRGRGVPTNTWSADPLINDRSIGQVVASTENTSSTSTTQADSLTLRVNNRLYKFAHYTTVPFSVFASSEASPFLEAPSSILALWLPNCIARFFRLLASSSPSLFAASRSSILSPRPSPSRGSSLRCTPRQARNATTLSDRNGYRASFPCEDMMRSSRPRLRVGRRVRSSWSCRGRLVKLQH